LNVRQLQHNGVRPLTVVLKALGEHGADVQAVGLLLDSSPGNDSGVFEDFVVLAKHAGFGLLGRTDGMEQNVFPVAALPWIRDDYVDGVFVLLPGEPSTFVRW